MRSIPRIVGDVQAENKTGPGWANPVTETWDDPRIVGRDDRHYGPLPREWGHYEGMYHYGESDGDLLSRRYDCSARATGVVNGNARPGLCAPSAVWTACPAADAASCPTGRMSNSVLSQVAANAVLLGPAESPLDVPTSPGLEFDGQTFAQLDEAGDFDLTQP